MSAILRYKQLLLVLALLLVVSAAAVYFWDIRYKLNLQLLSSIVAGVGAAVGMTLFLHHRDQVKWKRARSIFLREISVLSDRMLTYIGPLINVPLPLPGAPGFENISEEYYLEHVHEIFSKYFSEGFVPFTKQSAQDVKIDQQKWGYCLNGIELLNRRLDSTISTPPPTALSPELLETTTMVGNAVDALTHIKPLFLPSPASTEARDSESARSIAVKSLQSLVVAILNLRRAVDALLKEPESRYKGAFIR